MTLKAVKRFCVIHFYLSYRYTPLVGGNYIPSPIWLARKKATVNIQTKDGRCIIDCINAKLHPYASNPHRQSHYARYRADIKTEGVNFPAGVRDINKLEKMNPQFSINIYAYELKKGKGKRQGVLFYPFRISKNRGEDKTIVNLLLLEENHSSRRHYILIKDFSRLTRYSNSQHDGRTYACPFCLRHFRREALLVQHEPLCRQFKPSATRYPEKDKDDRMKFTSYAKQHPAKFVAYCDFETMEVLRKGSDQPPESLLPPEMLRKHPWIKFPSEEAHAETCRRCTTLKPCPKIRNSTQTHCALEPFSFAFKVVSTEGPKHDFPLRIYQGPDCAQTFLRWLKEDMTRVHEILNRKVPIRMTPEDLQRHRASTHCEVCKEAYTSQNHKVRDHDHTILEGPNYRQPCCNRCNLAWKAAPVSIFAHNMSGA